MTKVNENRSISCTKELLAEIDGLAGVKPPYNPQGKFSVEVSRLAEAGLLVTKKPNEVIGNMMGRYELMVALAQSIIDDAHNFRPMFVTTVANNVSEAMSLMDAPLVNRLSAFRDCLERFFKGTAEPADLEMAADKTMAFATKFFAKEMAARDGLLLKEVAETAAEGYLVGMLLRSDGERMDGPRAITKNGRLKVDEDRRAYLQTILKRMEV